MSAIPCIPSRPFSLSTGDVDVIKSSQNREAIGGRLSHIWDRLMDFICSTNRVQAKQCLFDMFSPTTPDLKKIEHFRTLETLVDAGFQGTFETTKNENGDESYSLTLPDSNTPCFRLLRTNHRSDRNAIMQGILEDLKKGNAKQLLADLHRGTYTIEGHTLCGSQTEQRQQWDDGLTTLQCTDAQQEAVNSLCNQTTFLNIMEHTTNVAPSSEQAIAPDCHQREGAIVTYHVSRPDEQSIRVRGNSSQDIAAGGDLNQISELLVMARENPSAQNSVDIAFEISIDKEGQMTLDHLHYLCNRDIPDDNVA